MEAEYTTLEKSYLIEQRIGPLINKHGSIQKAIDYCKNLLNECRDNWNNCSYDCVGHAMTLCELMIPRLEERLTKQN